MSAGSPGGLTMKDEAAAMAASFYEGCGARDCGASCPAGYGNTVVASSVTFMPMISVTAITASTVTQGLLT
ncbi:hypothetical protein OJJOAM_000179 [Cupriavidus sp. H18C1]